jgi:hypothetical protein
MRQRRGESNKGRHNPLKMQKQSRLLFRNLSSQFITPAGNDILIGDATS